jgi:hypothetical protein
MTPHHCLSMEVSTWSCEVTVTKLSMSRRTSLFSCGLRVVVAVAACILSLNPLLGIGPVSLRFHTASVIFGVVVLGFGCVQWISMRNICKGRSKRLLVCDSDFVTVLLASADRLLVVSGVGVHLSSASVAGKCTSTFIPASDVEDIVIVEAFQRFRVVTALIVTRRNYQDSVVVFPVRV